MTCREKLKMECPEKVPPWANSGCLGCPHDYGYLERPETKNGRCSMSCAECWNRKIPGTEPTKDLKIETVIEIETILMNSDLKWQINYDPVNSSYHIDIN